MTSNAQAMAEKYVDYRIKLIQSGEIESGWGVESLPRGKRLHLKKLFDGLMFACGSAATAWDFIGGVVEQKGVDLDDCYPDEEPSFINNSEVFL